MDETSEMENLFHELSTVKIFSKKFLLFNSSLHVKRKKLNGVYIRDCFEFLADKINNSSSSGVNKFLIIADYGMGKTFFSYYLTHILIKRKHNIVYENQENKRKYYFDSQLCKLEPMRDEQNLNSLLECRQVWFIYDGNGHRSFEAQVNQVIISSNMTFYTMCDTFNNYQQYYLANWSIAELKLVKNMFFPQLDDLKFTESLTKFGRSPKFTVEMANRKDLFYLLDDCILRFDLEESLLNHNMEKNRDMYSMMLNLKVNQNNLKNLDISFASDYISEKIVLKYFHFNQNLLKSVIRLTRAFESLDSVSFSLFKSYAVLSLSKGGLFKMKDLGSERCRENALLFPGRERKTFARFSDLKKCENYHENFWIKETVIDDSEQKRDSFVTDVDAYVYPNYFFKLILDVNQAEKFTIKSDIIDFVRIVNLSWEKKAQHNLRSYANVVFVVNHYVYDKFNENRYSHIGVINENSNFYSLKYALLIEI